MNVFGGAEEKMAKIEKMLKLRKFAYYVLEGQCKNKENWHFMLYYVILYYIILCFIFYIMLYLTRKKKNETRGT